MRGSTDAPIDARSGRPPTSRRSARTGVISTGDFHLRGSDHRAIRRPVRVTSSPERAWIHMQGSRLHSLTPFAIGSGA